MSSESLWLDIQVPVHLTVFLNIIKWSQRSYIVANLWHVRHSTACNYLNGLCEQSETCTFTAVRSDIELTTGYVLFKCSSNVQEDSGDNFWEAGQWMGQCTLNWIDRCDVRYSGHRIIFSWMIFSRCMEKRFLTNLAFLESMFAINNVHYKMSGFKVQMLWTGGIAIVLGVWKPQT